MSKTVSWIETPIIARYITLSKSSTDGVGEGDAENVPSSESSRSIGCALTETCTVIKKRSGELSDRQVGDPDGVFDHHRDDLSTYIGADHLLQASSSFRY